MTYDDALGAAWDLAHETGKPVDIWEHVGYGNILPQGRFISRANDKAPPGKVWARKITIPPEGLPPAPVVEVVGGITPEVQNAIDVVKGWAKLSGQDLLATQLDSVVSIVSEQPIQAEGVKIG